MSVFLSFRLHMQIIFIIILFFYIFLWLKYNFGHYLLILNMFNLFKFFQTVNNVHNFHSLE